MSNPSETPPPNLNPEDDDIMTVEVISPRKGKGKGKVKTTISTTYSLRSSDRQRLLEPSTSESTSSELASTGTELEEGGMESGPSPVHSILSRNPSSNPSSSSSPSIAFPYDDIDETPSIKKRVKIDDDEISNVSDQPIDIDLDYELSEPVAGPSGLQPPVVSPSIIVPIDMRPTSGTSISSTASRTTYSGLERPIRRQMPTPAPPKIDSWDELVYTISKYTSYFLSLVQLTTTSLSLYDQKIFGYPKQLAFFYTVFSVFACLSTFFGLYIGELSFPLASCFGYFALLLAVASEFHAVFSFWGFVTILLIVSMSIFLFTALKWAPRDLAIEYHAYRRAISSHEIVTSSTEESTDTEAACELQIFPGVDLRMHRMDTERPGSRSTIRSSSRAFSPIDSSRATSRGGHNISADAIIEVSREDDSSDIAAEDSTETEHRETAL